MNKIIGGVVALVIIIAAVIAVAAGGNDNKKTTTTSANNAAQKNTTNNTPANNGQTAQNANKVNISNFAFSPATLTVKKGTTVTWTNNDSVTHTVTSNSDHGPSSGNLSPGQTYNFTFTDEGTFNYSCTIHPEMHGAVTVTE